MPGRIYIYIHIFSYIHIHICGFIGFFLVPTPGFQDLLGEQTIVSQIHEIHGFQSTAQRNS